jgi:peptidoglycan/LPS O-acetylase OafA/YrhL
MSHTLTEAVDPNLPRIWIQPHYNSFNGLRAVAVLGVFVAHYGRYWGLELPQYFLWSGVDLFFVLSGFLITGILYDSLQNPHYFRDFYVRRALRIFPVLYALFLLLLLITPLLHLVYSPLLWTYAVYVGNLVFPFQMRTGFDISAIQIVRHGLAVRFTNIHSLWSLCVEEQFYLLWPAIVWWVRDRRRLMQLCVVLCLLVIPLRVFLHAHYNFFFLLYESTYTRFDTLLVGAWMALWLRGRALSLRHLQRLSFVLFWVPCIVVIVMVLRVSHGNPNLVQHSRFVTTIGFTLIALAFAGLILRSLDDSSRLSRVLCWKPLNALGIISYGFYVIHFLPMDQLAFFVASHPRWAPALPVFAFVITVGLATLSFHYLETPFLRLKRVLAPQQLPEDTTAPVYLHVSEPAV